MSKIIGLVMGGFGGKGNQPQQPAQQQQQPQAAPASTISPTESKESFEGAPVQPAANPALDFAKRMGVGQSAQNGQLSPTDQSSLGLVSHLFGP